MIAVVFLLALPATLGAVLEGRATTSTACNADNCARALTGTFQGTSRPASRIGDCSAFQLVTVQPPATTTTTTSGTAFTISTTTISPAAITPGTTTPFMLPAYAVASCGPSESAVSRFSSACSCAGVSTRSTTTLPQPTVVLTYPLNVCTNPYPTFANYRCYNGPSGTLCACFRSKNNPPLAFCYDGYSPCSTACNLDTDCPQGTTCLDAASTNCAPAGPGFCGVSSGYDMCRNPALMALRKLRRSGDGPTPFNKPDGL